MPDKTIGAINMCNYCANYNFPKKLLSPPESQAKGKISSKWSVRSVPLCSFQPMPLSALIKTENLFLLTVAVSCFTLLVKLHK